MDEMYVDIVGYSLLDKCKCCLGDEQLRGMWVEHSEEDRTEIYGEMLNECFGVPGNFQYNIEIGKQSEQICQSCVCRLRHALDFKREVLACAQIRFEHLNQYNTVKLEIEECDEEYVEPCNADNAEVKPPIPASTLQKKTIEVPVSGPKKHFAPEPKKPMVKFPKKKPQLKRLTANRRSTRSMVDRAMDEVESGSLSVTEAAKEFNVPKHTLTTRLLITKRSQECNTVKEEIEECDDEETAEEASDHDPDSGCADEQDFEDVVYLELDDADNTEVKPKKAALTRKKEPVQLAASDLDKKVAPEPEKPKPKWPRKKTQWERLTTYRNYTMEDMVRAIESVQSGKFTPIQASKEFNVPKKTLNGKLLKAKRKKDESDNEKQDKVIKKEKHFKFINEVKKIITYTNAIPFKTKASRYFCHYCSTNGPSFEDPDELRAHTRTEHVNDKTRSIEILLRPQSNEVIKLDIDSLHCTICCTVIPSWVDMFKHLEEVHEIELDEAYNKVIPYLLKRDLSCVLCKDSFPNFHLLDGHMNTHYANYMCSDCGETFLSGMRLFWHAKVHQTGQFPCETCGKVFELERNRRKHNYRLHRRKPTNK